MDGCIDGWMSCQVLSARSRIFDWLDKNRVYFMLPHGTDSTVRSCFRLALTLCCSLMGEIRTTLHVSYD